MTEGLLTDDADAPESATHRIDISVYVSCSDERATEIATSLVDGSADNLSIYLDIPELVEVAPRLSID